MTYNYKITDLKFKIQKLVPEQSCKRLIEIYEKYPDLCFTEQSYKYESKKQEEDNFKCLNLSSINNPNKDILEALNICRTYISVVISNYVLHIRKNICPTFLDNYMRKTNNIRILKYNLGECIKDHTDAHIDSGIRASCTLNLNEDYVGGDFRFFNGQVKESFKTGDAMIFPAEPIWIHGTEPITKGVRYSVNCFLS